jgi:hypothetical protein
MSRWFDQTARTSKKIGDVEMDYAICATWRGRLWRFSMIKVVEGGRRARRPAPVTRPEWRRRWSRIAGLRADSYEPGAQGRVPADVLQLAAGAHCFSAEVARVQMARRSRGYHGRRVARRSAKWGEQGLIELAFTIATAFYPAVKRGMGYAHTCERVVVSDAAATAEGGMSAQGAVSWF